VIPVSSSTPVRWRPYWALCHASIPPAASRRCLAKAKRGDVYLRTLVMHRGNCNIAAVALVNKNARTMWALVAHNQTYEPLLSKATFYNWKAEYSGLTVA
jgi:hypothetical protein